MPPLVISRLLSQSHRFLDDLLALLWATTQTLTNTKRRRTTLTIHWQQQLQQQKQNNINTIIVTKVTVTFSRVSSVSVCRLHMAKVQTQVRSSKPFDADGATIRTHDYWSIYGQWRQYFRCNSTITGSTSVNSRPSWRSVWPRSIHGITQSLCVQHTPPILRCWV